MIFYYFVTEKELFVARLKKRNIYITVTKLEKEKKFNANLVSGSYEVMEPMCNRITWPQRCNLQKNWVQN